MTSCNSISEMAYKNILVAIDSSNVANLLIKRAHEMAPNAHLDILNVVDTSGGYFVRWL